MIASRDGLVRGPVTVISHPISEDDPLAFRPYLRAKLFSEDMSSFEVVCIYSSSSETPLLLSHNGRLYVRFAFAERYVIYYEREPIPVYVREERREGR